MSRGWFDRVYGSGASSLKSDSAGRLSLRVPALSAVVYRAEDHVPRSKKAPDISLRLPSAPARDRVEIAAEVSGSSFYEVTFLAREHGRWKAIGTDDNAPYRVFHDIADERPGTRIEYKAVVLDNAGHERTSRDRSLTVAPPAIALEAPPQNGRVRGIVEVRAVATPEHAHYTRHDPALGQRRAVHERRDRQLVAGLHGLQRHVEPARRSAGDLPRRADLRAREDRDERPAHGHHRPGAGDDRGHPLQPDGRRLCRRWGLHLFGDGLAPGEATAVWENPTPFERQLTPTVHCTRITIADDTKRVGFIVHRRPPGDPNVKDTDPAATGSSSRSTTPEIWLRQGDAADL